MVVVVVPVEHALHRVAAQTDGVLFELRVVQVLPLFVDVLLVEVVFQRRDEGGTQTTIIKVSPGEVSQPGMVFDLVRPIDAESVLGLPLDHFVDEVSCLDRPASGHLALLYLYLLGQNVVSDFLPRFAHIRSSAVHALVGHDSHGEVIHHHIVVLPAHHLGSHVAWSSRSVLGILRSPDSCDSEVGDSEVALVIND